MSVSRPIALAIIAMASVVVLSNVLVQHLLGNWLTWGALTYPFAFLITDITNRLFGTARARQVVCAGFVVGVLCSLVASQVVSSEGHSLTTLRIATGSGTAFLVAQLVDVSIFNKLRHDVWWRAPLASTFVGSMLDTTLFFSIAFAGFFAFIDPNDPNTWALEVVPLLGLGPAFPLWVSLAVADFGVKLLIAAIALIPFRVFTTKAP